MTRQRGEDVGEGEMRVEITRQPTRSRGGGGIDYDALSFHPERLLATEEWDPAEDSTDPQTWFVEAGDVFAQAFCVTLVQAVTVDEAFRRLKAKAPGVGSMGFDDLVENAYERQEEGRSSQLVGASEVDGWTLLLEPNGFACTDAKRKRGLSQGTTVITLYLNFNGANEFSVMADGVLSVSFDIMLPAEREGDRPDELVDDLLAAGFSLDPDDDEAADDDGSGSMVAGAALVERLTGIRLTVGLLTGLQYRTGLLKAG